MVGPWQMVMSVTPFSRMTGGCKRRRDVRGVMLSCGGDNVGDPSSSIMMLIILWVSFMLSKSVVTFLTLSRKCFRDGMVERFDWDSSW